MYVSVDCIFTFIGTQIYIYFILKMIKITNCNSLFQKNTTRLFSSIPSAGHLSPDKMISRIQKSFYWPAMKKYVVDYCRKCDKCAARKPSKQSNKAPLGQYLVGEPMERVVVDILGPLPLTERENRYILVLCDCFTKWTEAYPEYQTKNL